MKKSYTPNEDRVYNINGQSVKLTTSDSVLISEEVVPKGMTLNTDWQSVVSSVDDSGTLEVVKTIEEIKYVKDVKDVDGNQLYKSKNKFVVATISNAAGADALMVEVHPHPEKALSDGPQSLHLEEFDKMMKGIRPVAKCVGREI